MPASKVCKCSQKVQRRYLWWQPCVNEDGWMCGQCRKPIGFSPWLDRECTAEKAHAILGALAQEGGKIVYVSSGSVGLDFAEHVARHCHEEGQYDQHTIALRFLEHAQPTHAEYWKERAEKVLAQQKEADDGA